MLNWFVLLALAGKWRSRLVLAVLLGGILPGFSQSTKFVTIADQFDLQEALSGGGTVQFQVAGTIFLTSTIEITNDTTLDGHGQAIGLSGSNAVQVFHVFPGINFAVSNLTIISGSNNLGAAIFNDKGTTTVQGCVFSGNIASGLAGSPGGTGPTGNGRSGGNGTSAEGGAIYNTGYLRLIECQLENNAALGGQGGAGGNGSGNGGLQGYGGSGGNGGLADGGAIYNSGTLIVSDTLMTNNQAIAGFGGTNGTGGTLFSSGGQGGAGAGAAGGAIYSTGILVVTNSTFITNSVTGGTSQSSGTGDGLGGGAALGGAIYNSGTLIAGNATFFANPVTGGSGGSGGNTTFPGNGGNGGNAIGGAIYTSSSADLLNCTLADGSASGGTNGVGANDGAFVGTDGLPGQSLGANIAVAGGTAALRNTILAYPAVAANASGAIMDKGHNLSSDTSAAFTAIGSSNNIDPLLQAPAVNPGPNTNLPTMALSFGSPAIAAGDPAFSPSSDERGIARSTSNPGIGAYEFNSFTVEGAVYKTNSPVTGVTVELGAMTNTTDVNGNYAFSNLLAGVYTLSFSDPGYSIVPAEQVVNLTQSAQPTVVVNSTVYSPLGLQVMPGLGGGGALLQISGAPVERATLQATTDFRNWTAIGVYTLNTNGVFSVNDTGATNYSHRFYRARPAP